MNNTLVKAFILLLAIIGCGGCSRSDDANPAAWVNEHLQTKINWSVESMSMAVSNSRNIYFLDGAENLWRDGSILCESSKLGDGPYPGSLALYPPNYVTMYWDCLAYKNDEHNSVTVVVSDEEPFSTVRNLLWFFYVSDTVDSAYLVIAGKESFIHLVPLIAYDSHSPSVPYYNEDIIRLEKSNLAPEYNYQNKLITVFPFDGMTNAELAKSISYIESLGATQVLISL